jgi:hypothetical protein
MRLSARAALLSIGMSTLAVSAVAAQDEGQSPRDHDTTAPRAAVSATTAAIRVDGQLDEAAWAAATPITSFTQLNPSEGAAASEPTDIRFLYDDDALYIGARLDDSQPVTARLGRRDMNMSASDWLTVIIDSYHDHRTAYGFELNPAGVRRDQTRGDTGEDDSWDPVWEASTTVTADGWVAEIRIPFSQLRFSGADVQTWGLQVERQIARVQEFAVWSFTPRDQPGGIPRFGHLTGLTNIPTGKRLEVLPYTVSRAEYIDRGSNTFRDDQEYGIDAGVDLKYRVTSNLTLDATFNPDFGQVEVDPAVVNLTAFETFFPEKRPFFVEGAEIFRFGDDGSNNVFYSRRIGRRPTVAPQYTDRDVPDATRILGAAKLSGRTGSGWSIGVFDAVTNRETARFRDGDGAAGEAVAEPLANYFVSRVRRDMRGGLTSAGGFFGAVNRDLETDLLAQTLRSAAYTGGLDLFHQWDERTWTVRSFLAGSHVRGEPATIAAAQRAPYHYFQRPDATHLDYDPDATTMSGLAGSIAANKRIGRHWNLGGGLNTITPGYEVSDLGFQRRADRLDAQLNVSYSETRPGDLLRNYSMYWNGLVEHNYAGENISNRIFAGGNTQFLNYWTAGVNLNVSFGGTLDDRLTRGGPAASRPGYVNLFGFAASDPRKALVTEFGGQVQRDDAGGHAEYVFAFLQAKPAPNWELSVGPSVGTTTSAAQYLLALPDETATATHGARYVFAELDQTVVAMEGRLNYTFTPGLSLQVFAQPFIATGAYGPAMEFARPNTFDFLVYGEETGEIADGRIYPDGFYAGAPSFAVPQPDFNVHSLRGNAVLRWEWRPGSTLYVAWQQTRDGFEPIGDFDLGRDVDAIFSARADNVFLVKINYWLNP